MSTYLNEVLDFQQRSENINKVSVILSNYEPSIKKYENINYYFYDYERKPKHFLGAIKQIQKIIKKEQPDIVHIHSTFAGFFTRLPLFLKIKRPKIIYCSHGWSFTMNVSTWKKNIYGIIEKILAIKTDLIINISKSELEDSLNYKLPLAKSVVIYNGINHKSHTSNSELSELEIDYSKINLLFIGRFDEQKGVDILTNFFAKNDFENIKLYLIGESVLNRSPLKMSNNVVPIGWVDNELIDNYYKKFDAIIVPSRWEGFGLVAIEAMRNKKALIVSNRGALPEIVQNGSNGYTFDIDSEEELRGILSNLNKDQLMSMGEKGYKLFLEKFNSKNMNEQIMKKYDLLIKN
ncbi:glycosyltransferase [Priestia aryabhattai]|uniref:glycosyltransferase n=1 Tax=Priestia aryabhattai TaxID=412384 RepID=UPI0027E07BD8|nr:glycosyltransferase [Priestia aryabhattai]